MLNGDDFNLYSSVDKLEFHCPGHEESTYCWAVKFTLMATVHCGIKERRKSGSVHRNVWEQTWESLLS